MSQPDPADAAASAEATAGASAEAVGEGGPWCAACGAVGTAGEGETHARCAAALELDTPRFCTRCGRRLDVQVYPTSVSATCRRCDGVHPRDRGR